MKTVKRNFLVVEEKLRFNNINDFSIVRYFNPSHFILDDTLNLHINYSDTINIENIRIVARYIDASKSMERYEPLECFEEIKVPVPKRDLSKKNEIVVSLKLKEGSNFLWKIGLQIFPKHDSLLYLSIT